MPRLTRAGLAFAALLAGIACASGGASAGNQGGTIALLDDAASAA